MSSSSTHMGLPFTTKKKTIGLSEIDVVKCFFSAAKREYDTSTKLAALIRNKEVHYSISAPSFNHPIRNRMKATGGDRKAKFPSKVEVCHWAFGLFNTITGLAPRICEERAKIAFLLPLFHRSPSNILFSKCEVMHPQIWRFCQLWDFVITPPPTVFFGAWKLPCSIKIHERQDQKMIPLPEG